MPHYRLDLAVGSRPDGKRAWLVVLALPTRLPACLRVGLLVSGDKEPSRRKSLVLLLGRLLMTSLFIYVGLVQVGPDSRTCFSGVGRPGVSAWSAGF